MFKSIRIALPAMVGGIILTIATGVQAYSVYNVNLNTAPLMTSPAGPFSMDFQLVDGSGTGDGNNTVILSDFVFGGGSASTTATLTGGSTGSALSQIQMTDTSFFNEATEAFTPGSSLSFKISATNNVDAGGTPDEFSFAILDKTGAEIPTTDTQADSFITITFDSPLSVQEFPSDPSTPPAGGGAGLTIAAPTVQAVGSEVVPLPPAAWASLATLAGLAAIASFKAARRASRKRSM